MMEIAIVGEPRLPKMWPIDCLSLRLFPLGDRRGCLAKLASLVGIIRAEVGGPVVVLDVAVVSAAQSVLGDVA